MIKSSLSITGAFIFSHVLFGNPLETSSQTINYRPDLVVIILATFIVLGILLRGVGIRRLYKKLELELNERRNEIIEQEKEIRIQKDRLQEQINFSDQQNELIHKQTIELEKSRRLLEKTVESRTNELKLAKEKAEESDRLKTAFLENMSHEIRTPMNAIMGFASLLGFDDVGVEERVKYISRINKNCQMLLQLIDDIMDMSKIQADQLVIIKNEFSVNEILKSLYQIMLKEKSELGLVNVQVELVMEPGEKDFLLYSDSARFIQVMTNLLSNAFKYTEKGFIRFGYNTLYHSDFEKEPYMLQFFVEDSGIGIAPEKGEYIFEWFSKIEDDTTKLYRGAGLGLYISKQLVTMMGGRIWFNSKPMEGSTFYFTMPYFNLSDNKVRKTKKERQKKKVFAEKFNWQNKTILIAEDEQNNVIYLTEIIRRTGASILEARTGTQAVEIVTGNESISLVLMDIMMPELNGYEATRQIKQIRPNLPIIAQTAYSNLRERERSLEVGCDGYISKPYNPPELLNMINNFL
jgi:signal transduction histidine kinase